MATTTIDEVAHSRLASHYLQTRSDEYLERYKNEHQELCENPNFHETQHFEEAIMDYAYDDAEKYLREIEDDLLLEKAE